MRSIRHVLLLQVLVGLGSGCDTDNMQKEDTAANKAFILEMIGQKKQLTDYPDKASDSMVVYEPSSLPFGGTYRGIKAFEQFYPQVRKFYDFKRFHLVDVYADADKVFAISHAAIAHTGDSIQLCEEFTFDQGKIIEVRLYLYDYDNRPVHQVVAEAAHAGQQSAANPTDDETAIRTLEDRFVTAFNAGDIDGIMKNYLPDDSLVVFDVVPRKQYRGAGAYRKDWEDLFSHFKDTPKITITDLEITVNGNLGFSHSFQRVTGTDKQGHPVDRTVRVTDGYRKTGSTWLIALEHISVPVDLATGKADVVGNTK